MEPFTEDDEGHGRQSQAEQADAEDDERRRYGHRPVLLRHVRLIDSTFTIVYELEILTEY